MAKDIIDLTQTDNPTDTAKPLSPGAETLLNKFRDQYVYLLIRQAQIFGRDGDMLLNIHIQRARDILAEPRRINKMRQGSILLAGAVAGYIFPAAWAFLQQVVAFFNSTGTINPLDGAYLITTIIATGFFAWYGFGQDSH